MGPLIREGIRFSYLDRGTGAAFVFQHGLGGDMGQPAGLYESPGRLICLECRGHGATEPLGRVEDLNFATFAGDLVALLDHLELDTVVLGGISMGAGVAQRLAAEHPERVRALILVRPSWFDAPWPPHLRIYGTVAEILRRADGEAGKVLLRETDEFRTLCRRPGGTSAAASLLSQFDRPFARDRAPILRHLPGDFPLAGGPPWDAITAPALILGTNEDPPHPLAVAEQVAAAIPHAQLQEITPKSVDAGQHARDVTTAIDDFTAAVVD